MKKLTALQCRQPSKLKALPKVHHKRALPFLGQQRATEAFELALEVNDPCYHLFVAGDFGTGRETYVLDALTRHASGQADGRDLVYVNNFEDENRPLALELPATRGVDLAQDLEKLALDVQKGVTEVFEREGLEGFKMWLLADFQRHAVQTGAMFNDKVRSEGFLPKGEGDVLVWVPAKEVEEEGEKRVVELTEAELVQLTDEQKKQLTEKNEALQGLRISIHEGLRRREVEMKELVAQRQKELATQVIKSLMTPLRRKYGRLKEVSAWLLSVRDYLIENFADLLGENFADTALLIQANVVVAAGRGVGAPVIREDNPTYYNLSGKVEYEFKAGFYATDFTQIVAGALHAARDGYLVLDAESLLRQYGSYEVLKRTLRSGLVTLDPIGEYGAMVLKTPKPEPVAWQGRVVLLGSRETYYLLCEYDDEFSKLFKLGVQFDDEMPRTAQSEEQLGDLLVQLSADQGYRPFDLGGLQELLAQASRMTDDNQRLTLRMNRLLQLVAECDATAGKKGLKKITASVVQETLDHRRFRAGLYASHRLDATLRDVVNIQVEGQAQGQVNGLSVVTLGQEAFGHPMRLTASASMGKGGVVHIERETRQAGPIHNKGLLTLEGYFNSLHARHFPLNFTALLSFEQLYGGVEGDSATLAELLALTSEISGLPLRQDLAVTGSVDQKGNVQAIGGVNEKIEGFFDLCAARGLTGTQGVVIPASNAQHLMLDRRVVEAVAEGSFSIYTVATADEALELFFGLKAGKPTAKGFAKNTVHGAVNRQLRYWTIEAPKALAKELSEVKKGTKKRAKKETKK